MPGCRLPERAQVQEKGCPTPEAQALTYTRHCARRARGCLAPADGKCHKWVGIALNAAGNLEGTKASIANAYTVRDHWEAAVALDPPDATVVAPARALGVRAREPGLGLPAGRLSHLRGAVVGHVRAGRAEAIDPGFWKKNTAMVGEALLELGRRAEAKEWLQKAAAIATVIGEECAAELQCPCLLQKITLHEDA